MGQGADARSQRLTPAESEIRVLHVDDDPSFGDLTETVLEREDDRLSVETVVDTDEAHDRLAAESWDCVVSDYDMPGSNGIEFLRAVRERYPDLPFILFTGKGSETVASDAISAGVTDYLQKEAGTDQYTVLANRITNAVDRARTKERLERQNDLFTKAEEIGDVGAWEYDVDADELFWTERTYHIHGVSRDFEPSLESIQDLYHPEDRPMLSEEVDTAIVEGEPYDVEARVVSTEEERWIRTIGEPQIEAGEVTRVRGTVRDITERKRREQELERQNDLFRKAQEIADVGAWEYDARADNLIWTERVYEIHRVAEEFDPSPERAIEFYHPEDRSRVQSALQNALEGEPYDVEARLVTADGDQRWVRTRGDPQTENGDLVRVRGTIQDITGRKERERELRQQNERFDEIAGVISHDLQTPLATARGRVELAAETGDVSHAADALDALDRLDELRQDLAELLRTQELIDERTEVALADVAEAAWETVDPHPAATLEVVDQITVVGDASALERCFENLLSNAVEHGSTSPPSQAQDDAVEHGATDSQAPEGAAAEGAAGVTVRVGTCEGGFYVADDGPGVPEDRRDEIFSPGTSTDPDSSGMGLTSVRQIVQAHGWRIDVTESAEGGARFEITGVETT